MLQHVCGIRKHIRFLIHWILVYVGIHTSHSTTQPRQFGLAICHLEPSETCREYQLHTKVRLVRWREVRWGEVRWPVTEAEAEDNKGAPTTYLKSTGTNVPCACSLSWFSRIFLSWKQCLSYYHILVERLRRRHLFVCVSKSDRDHKCSYGSGPACMYLWSNRSLSRLK